MTAPPSAQTQAGEEDKPMLSRTQLAARIGVSIRTVGRWLQDGCPYVNVGTNAGRFRHSRNKRRCPRFDLAQVKAWLTNH